MEYQWDSSGIILIIIIIIMGVYGGFRSYGGTQMVGFCQGKSHLEMDENCGYPYFRKPPYRGDIYIYNTTLMEVIYFQYGSSLHTDVSTFQVFSVISLIGQASISQLNIQWLNEISKYLEIRQRRWYIYIYIYTYQRRISKQRSH